MGRLIKRKELKSKPNRWTPSKGSGDKYRKMSMAYALGHHAPKAPPQPEPDTGAIVKERKRKPGIKRGRNKPLEWVPYPEFAAMHSAHLASPKWKKTKAKLFALRGKKCERCGSVERIEVHHKHYHNLGRERLRDLEILCRNCHADHHGRPA